VLGDWNAGGGHDDGGPGRDVDRVLAVPARATGVEDQRQLMLDLDHARAHGLGGCGEHGAGLPE
jgi:hypothetical protein